MVGKYQRHSYKPSKPAMRSYAAKHYYGETTPMIAYSAPLKKDTRLVYVTFKKNTPSVSREELLDFFSSHFGDVVRDIRMDRRTRPWFADVELYTAELVDIVLAVQAELPLKFIYNGKSIWVKRSIK